MLDFTIILILILGAAGIGYGIIDILPTQMLEQVTNPEGLRVVTSGFGAVFGGIFGFVVKTAYRRLESQVRGLPIDVLLTRAVGLVTGLLLANLMLAPIFFLPIPSEFSFIKPLIAILGRSEERPVGKEC